jgi:hypothetical protein
MVQKCGHSQSMGVAAPFGRDSDVLFSAINLDVFQRISGTFRTGFFCGIWTLNCQTMELKKEQGFLRHRKPLGRSGLLLAVRKFVTKDGAPVRLAVFQTASARTDWKIHATN